MWRNSSATRSDPRPVKDSSPGAALGAALPGDELIYLQTALVGAGNQERNNICLPLYGAVGSTHPLTTVGASRCPVSRLPRGQLPMTFDGSSAESRPSSTFRAPAQDAIREFLAGHRLRPARSARERALGRSPLGESGAEWYWSAVGQLEVASRLENLGPEWTVVHGIGGPSMNIDHLVIGPAGVFAVCTHDHTKQNVWVSGRAFVADGHSLQYLRAAEEAIGYVERNLEREAGDRKSTRLNSSHVRISYAVFCLKKKNTKMRASGLDDAEIVDVINAAAFFNWANRLMLSLGEP